VGYVRHKYTRAYFLKKDAMGNPTVYGAEGVEEFKKGAVRKHDLDILQRLDFKGKAVLDLGYGRGAMIKYAKDEGAARVVGVDFSPDAHAIAQELLNRYHVTADLYCDDALNFLKSYALQENIEDFDIVLMLDFVEHVPRSELTEILKLLHKVLSPRAIVAINTPIYPIDNDVIRDGLDPKSRDTSDEFEETTGMHCNRYTKQSLQKYMKECEFLAISGHFFVPHPSIPNSLEVHRVEWMDAFALGFPIRPFVQSQTERFEYALSWEEIKRRQKRSIFKRLGSGKQLVRASLRRIQSQKDSLFRKMVTFALPKIAKGNRYFDHWQSLGFHVTPTHFHQPIPDTRTLRDEIWDKKSELVGMEMNPTKQLDFLSKTIPLFMEECDFPREATTTPHEFFRQNGAFLTVDAEVYHCMIRHFKSKIVIEAGSGATTYLAARACRLNWEKEKVKTDLVAIDPYPNKIVRSGFPGFSGLLEKKMQDIDLDFFSQLGENDILFVDSTHIAQIGSDVNYIFLEVLPRLKKGVIIHIHDIFIPAEYPKKWIFEDRFFWTEQYILQAFLSFNPDFEVLWASSYMHENYAGKLKTAFPAFQDLGQDYPFYPEVVPSSFWFRRAKD